LDENSNRKVVNNFPGLFCPEKEWLHPLEELKIPGNFQNLEMCGIYKWSYPSGCRASKKRLIRNKGEHRFFLEILETHDAL